MWRRQKQSVEDRELILDLARIAMRIDAKLDRVLRILGDDVGEDGLDT